MEKKDEERTSTGSGGPHFPEEHDDTRQVHEIANDSKDIHDVCACGFSLLPSSCISPVLLLKNLASVSIRPRVSVTRRVSPIFFFSPATGQRPRTGQNK